MSRPGARALLAGLGVVALGCRNPFDPSADVRVEVGGFVIFDQSNAATQVSQMWTHTVQFTNYSSVPARFTSYTVVYRQVGAQTDPACPQPPGQPVCSLGGAAGRRYPLVVEVGPRITNDAPPATGFASVLIYTPEFFRYVSTHGETTEGGFDVELTFFGTDDNGHDLTVSEINHADIIP